MRDTTRLYATADAADVLGISPSQVRRIAEALNVGRRIGARSLLFTDTDLDVMRQRKTTPGREPAARSD